MRPKITYYFTYELRRAGIREGKRGGLVFKSVSIHPEHFTRNTLWPEVLKIEPEYTEAYYRGHEIHDWGYEDIVYQPVEIDDKEF
jgi:hypothetical protein